MTATNASPKIQTEHPKGQVNGNSSTTTSSSNPSTPSTLSKIWRLVKTKPDLPTLIFMLKGSLPILICLCLLETDLFDNKYGTTAYVSAIIAMFCMAPLPRAKFNQGIVLITLFECFAASIVLLGMYCGIKARESSSNPTDRYNSSQAAVCAVWLFFDIWLFSMLRSKMPMVTAPVFIQNVFAMILFTYAPRFPTMQASISVVLSILELFLIGNGVAAAVHYVVFPITTRTILFKQQHAFVGSLKNAIKLQSDCFGVLDAEKPGSNLDEEVRLVREKSAILKKATAGLKGQYDRLLGDIPFAKRELAWGKLSAHDISEIQTLFRKIMVLATGMSLVIEMLAGSTMKPEDSSDEDLPEVFGEKDSRVEEQRWVQTFVTFREPFQQFALDLDRGLQHAAITLQFQKPSKSKVADTENKGEMVEPGDQLFTQHFEERIKQFFAFRQKMVAAWKKEHSRDESSATDIITKGLGQVKDDKRVLVLLLYMGRLAMDMANAIRDIDSFADSKVADGTMKSNRLVHPDSELLRDWVRSLWDKSQGSLLSAPGGDDTYQAGLHGQAKNPEHLPPSNAWERYSDYLRKIAHLLSSDDSVFGFRVALATLSGTIMAFVRQTYDFYFDQRIIWSIIVIVVGWHRTAGQSFFSLIGRVIATLIGMCICWLAYYIPDGHAGGVLPLIWLGYFVVMYFIKNYPQYSGALLICCITMTSVTGNRLIANHISLAPYRAVGEIIYPDWELAPYRGLIVTIGCAIAFFWTIFPYPITERHVMRQELGTALYDLTIYHDCCQATIRMRLQGLEGDLTDKHSEGRQLESMRMHAFIHLRRLMPTMRARLNFYKYELPIGGRFPQERYAAILGRIAALLDCMTQMAHATNPAGDGSFAHLREAGEYWRAEVDEIVPRLDESARQISFAMTLLSGAIKHAVPLPPHFKAPEPFAYDRMAERLHGDIHEDGSIGYGNAYSTFAIVKVMSDLICAELDKLVGDVRELVGEVNYTVGPQKLD